MLDFGTHEFIKVEPNILSIDNVQVGVCQKWESSTIEIMLHFFFNIKMPYSCQTDTKLHMHDASSKRCKLIVQLKPRIKI